MTRFAAAIASSVAVLASAQGPVPTTLCPDQLKAVFADMHDGDKKEITVDGTALTIAPSGNNQTWVVKTVLDVESCSASIDFNVPGKPNPPPVNLTVSFWNIHSPKGKNHELEFTDPTGKLAAKDFPLNRWVQLGAQPQYQVPCPSQLDSVYADMHDGDKKQIKLTNGGTALTIQPYGNDQKWIVNAKVDTSACTAEIDFNVPGKPNPPPVNLLASFLYNVRFEGQVTKSEFEFTDPSGKLAAADFPLNAWVEIDAEQIAPAPLQV